MEARPTDAGNLINATKSNKCPTKNMFYHVPLCLILWALLLNLFVDRQGEILKMALKLDLIKINI